MQIARRLFILVAALAAFASVAPAYYYWIFFPSTGGSYTPIPGRFDLSALKDNTVQFFVSDQGPGSLVTSDTAIAIKNQILQAAAVWNGVASSALRLQFGGITKVGLPQAVPGIDVVFDDDMPPGILAQSKPTFPADLSFLSVKGTKFAPILRSRLQLRSDLASQQQASFSNAFFLTMVHEFGHNLGLQHTLTSGVMSTAITRATMKGNPLSADDVAGISQLYPVTASATSTGGIAGRVTLNGWGVNLASVVALSTNGTAISGMTNPDGTYQINGVPPGTYYVYAHPLPPSLQGESTPANIIAPVDPQGDDFAAFTGFGTLFFPGTKDWTKAKQVPVVLSQVTAGVDVAVVPRAGPAVHSMETYGYENLIPVAAPPLVAKTRNAVVFHAYGAAVNNETQIAPGLGVSVIGTAAQIESGSLKYYQQGFLQMAVDTNDTGGIVTPVALAVTLNDDLYVLPAGFTVVPNNSPSIPIVVSAVTDQGALAGIAGSNLSASTRFFMDGAPAPVLNVRADGSLALLAPPAPSGYVATLEAINLDGQSSLQALDMSATGIQGRPQYIFPLHDPATVAATPNSLTAGPDSWLTIRGVNTHFADGQTAVGFGSSDVIVRRVWVTSPVSILVNVSVNALATHGTTTLTVSTGLELITVPNAITVAPVVPGQMSVQLPIVNAGTGLAGVPAGGTALIATSGFPSGLAGWSLYIGGTRVPFGVIANGGVPNGMVTAQVPAGLTVGPQTVQFVPSNGAPNGVTAAPAVLVQIDAPPPSINAAAQIFADGSLSSIGPSAPVQLGSNVLLAVFGLNNATGVMPPASAVWITIAGLNYPAQAVTAGPKEWGFPTLVQFNLSKSIALDPAAPAKLGIAIGTGTRLSTVYSLDVAPVPAP